MIFNKITIIVNPASGQSQPDLSEIERVLRPRNLEWSLSTTRQDGDGRQFAQDALRAGVDLVVAYGGDGTVKDVINGLIGSAVPLAILPGGTGNALAHELHIPMALTEALTLLFDEHRLQSLDVGKVVKDAQPDQPGYFLLRMGVGLVTEIVGEASREEKERFGNLAYVMASLKSLANAKPLTFQLAIDQQEIEGHGLTCIVANSAVIGSGLGSFHFAPDVSFCDGMLDVFIFDASFNSILSVVGTTVNLDSFSKRWRGREIKVRVQQPQPFVIDGEAFGHTPVTVSVIPQAIKILVPEGK